MASQKMKIGIASIVTFLLYVTYVVLACIGMYTSDFNLESGEALLAKYDMMFFPSFKVYSALALIAIVANFIWLFYSLSCMCRQGDATTIFSIKFFIAFSLNICFLIGASFAWWKDERVDAFILVIFQMIFMVLAFGFQSHDLGDYMSHNEKNDENRCDIWCQRFIVQNALLFVLVVCTYFFIGFVSVFLRFELGASDFSVSLVMLILMGVLTLVWFVIESFVLKIYTEYTFSAYLVTIFYFSGTVAKVWDEDKIVGGFAVFFLVATCIIFIIRCFLLAYRSSKRRTYENISYSAKTQTVSA